MKKSKKRRMSAAETKRYVAAGEAAWLVAEEDIAFRMRLKIVIDRNIKNEDDARF